MRSTNTIKQDTSIDEDLALLPTSVACQLTPKHKLFVDKLFSDPDRVQWRAYADIYKKSNRRSAETQSSRLMKKPAIRAYLLELEQQAVESIGIDQAYVKQRLKDIGDRCMQAEPVMIWDADLKKLVESGEYKFDSGGALKSAELLGKDLGMFKPDRRVGEGVTVNLSLTMGGDRNVKTTVIAEKPVIDVDTGGNAAVVPAVRPSLSDIGPVLSTDRESDQTSP